jgi:hypothetical protein
MPPKKKAKRGRPKSATPVTPLHSIVSLKGSDELEAWLDELTAFSESGTRSQTLRRALRAFAEEQEFGKPIPPR